MKLKRLPLQNIFRKIKMTENLTKATFLEKVFNFEENKEWKFAGKRPALIDFYADWCGPCKTLLPTVEKLAIKHESDFVIAKVNVDKNRELAQEFKVRSIPALLRKSILSSTNPTYSIPSPFVF